MATVVFTAAARRDVRRILTYLADRGGHAVVADFAAAFTALQERLGTYPKAYATRPSLGPTIRVAVVAPYLAMYQHRQASDRVVVLRVVHGHRDITRNLLKTP